MNGSMKLKSAGQRLRHAIALRVLRMAFPASMRQAQSALVLPLPGSAKQAIEHLDLVALLRTPQICIDPAHPSLPPVQISALLGGAEVLVLRPTHLRPDESDR